MGPAFRLQSLSILILLCASKSVFSAEITTTEAQAAFEKKVGIETVRKQPEYLSKFKRLMDEMKPAKEFSFNDGKLNSSSRDCQFNVDPANFGDSSNYVLEIPVADREGQKPLEGVNLYFTTNLEFKVRDLRSNPTLLPQFQGTDSSDSYRYLTLSSSGKYPNRESLTIHEVEAVLSGVDSLRPVDIQEVDAIRKMVDGLKRAEIVERERITITYDKTTFKIISAAGQKVGSSESALCILN